MVFSFEDEEQAEEAGEAEEEESGGVAVMRVHNEYLL